QVSVTVAAHESERSRPRFQLREAALGPGRFLVKHGELPEVDERLEPTHLIWGEPVARPLQRHVCNTAELAHYEIRRDGEARVEGKPPGVLQYRPMLSAYAAHSADIAPRSVRLMEHCHQPIVHDVELVTDPVSFEHSQVDVPLAKIPLDDPKTMGNDLVEVHHAVAVNTR